MKRILTFLLCVIIVFASTSTCIADTLDKSAFENLDGYKYDKFTKKWSYFQAYSHEYKDAYLVVGIEVYGGNEEQMPPTLYCWIRDEKNNDVLHEVNKMMFLIGDDLFTFNNLFISDSSSTALLGEESKEFLEALSNGKEMSIRLSFKTGSIDEEVKSSEFEKTFKAAAKAILKSNIWDYVSDSWKEITTFYGPTKE